MKYLLISLLLLTGCTWKLTDDYENELQTKYKDGYATCEHNQKEKYKEEEPKFSYNDKVKVVKYFYKGLTGRVRSVGYSDWCFGNRVYTVLLKDYGSETLCENNLELLK